MHAYVITGMLLKHMYSLADSMLPYQESVWEEYHISPKEFLRPDASPLSNHLYTMKVGFFLLNLSAQISIWKHKDDLSAVELLC